MLSFKSVSFGWRRFHFYVTWCRKKTSVDLVKGEAIINGPRTMNVSEVWRFMAMVGYHRRFV